MTDSTPCKHKPLRESGIITTTSNAQEMPAMPARQNDKTTTNRQRKAANKPQHEIPPNSTHPRRIQSCSKSCFCNHSSNSLRKSDVEGAVKGVGKESLERRARSSKSGKGSGSELCDADESPLVPWSVVGGAVGLAATAEELTRA